MDMSCFFEAGVSRRALRALRTYGIRCFAMITVVAMSAYSVAEEKPSKSGLAWIDLSTGCIHADDGDAKPLGPIVTGEIKNEGFIPNRQAFYFGKLSSERPKDSIPGWIELKTGKIHRDVEAVAPLPPYLTGFVLQDAKKGFQVDGAALEKWIQGKEE
jgi:hypothetical protein